MFIQTEETPNPATLKFMPGRIIIEDTTAEFTTLEEASGTPLARQFLEIEGIKSVFFGSDFITITKSEKQDWFNIKPLILEHMVNYFATHEKISVAQKASTEHVDEDDIVKEIRELIDSRVRPAVAMDGGDIIFERFENGVVYLKLQGACAGCPSSSATLKSGIENMLKYYIPEVQEVRPIEDVA